MVTTVQTSEKVEGSVQLQNSTPTEEEIKRQNNTATSPNAAPQTSETNINVTDFVKETDEAIGDEEKAINARKAHALKRAKISKALQRTSTVERRNVTTNEVIGEYIEYLPDSDGKTLFDYASDPELSQVVELVYPRGYKEGDRFTEQVSLYWKDPKF